jgi:predicted ThiF/HesA family dinucleotide-utilizing enzyme
MKLKSLIAIGVFSLSILSAKSFEITLDTAAKAGNLDLKAGKYNVNLMEASKVRFTDVTSGKSVETTAKIVSADKKFASTTIDTKQVNGATQINEIDLGGTKTMVQFE